MLDPRRLRLTVVTSGLFGAGHGALVGAAIEGGATAVQLRAPELGDEDLRTLARETASRCHAAGVLCIVNDRLDVALESGADGVHLGQSDRPTEARARSGPDLVIGVSVADPVQAREAASAGADYLGVTVWATPTKPEATGIGLSGVREVGAGVRLPLVGIGGISDRNLADVLDAGAAGVAVISAVAAAPDPGEATRVLRAIIERWERERDGTAHR